ncbi:MAG: exodeoxyribonuclease VII small subunit [Coriobacteriia bacterium]
MGDESYGFTAARARLEEIVVQVRKKDTSLEKSLDLLEEGVRLANVCTELIDRADRQAETAEEEPEEAAGAEVAEAAEAAEAVGEAPSE